MCSSDLADFDLDFLEYLLYLFLFNFSLLIYLINLLKILNQLLTQFHVDFAPSAIAFPVATTAATAPLPISLTADQIFAPRALTPSQTP